VDERTQSRLQSAETILREKGGRLDPASVDGAAGQHVRDSVEIFRGHLQSIVVPGQEAVTRSTPPSRIAQFEYVQRWDVNAWATLAAEGPVVLFHAGIPFSLFEYFNSLLAHPATLPDLDGAAESAAPLEPLSRDFTAIVQAKWPMEHMRWSEYLRRKPRSNARQSIAHQLYLLAVRFLFCHELGHIDRGHLEFQYRRNRSYALSEFAVAAGDRPIAEQTALELEADHYATVQALSPYLARKKHGHYPLPRLGDAEAGTAECYRLVLFSIGALFLALECQQQPVTRRNWWSSIATRVMPPQPATHPDSMTRVRAALVFAQMTAAKSDASPQAIEVAGRAALTDLAAVAALLQLDVERLLAPARLVEASKLIRRLGELDSELTDCRTAVADRYFQSGQPVTLAQARANTTPVDLFGLRVQSLALYIDGEQIRIPFLHEDSPVADFVQNSLNWERAGYLDNAFVYAQLAIRRANAVASDQERLTAQQRLEAVACALGPHRDVVERLAREHGLIPNLAEQLFDASEDQQPVPGLAVVKDLESLCAIRPREGLHRRQLADALFVLRDFDAALHHYQLAEREELPDEDRIAVIVGSGNCLAERGKTDDALECFRDALKMDRTSTYAWTNLVICLVRGGRGQAAIDAVNEALATNEQHAEYWFLKAAACRGFEYQSQVKEYTERALSLDPTNPKYLLARGQLASEEKQFRDAVGFFSRALEAGADSSEARFKRGYALVALGETPAAKNDFAAVRDAGGELAAIAGCALEIFEKPERAADVGQQLAP
jgi:tetratricopeptide (TPR) repeat protein